MSRARNNTPFLISFIKEKVLKFINNSSALQKLNVNTVGIQKGAPYSNHKTPPQCILAGTAASRHCTPPTNMDHPNMPTPTHSDYQQSLTPSFSLTLCSFPWLSAALAFNVTLMLAKAATFKVHSKKSMFVYKRKILF